MILDLPANRQISVDSLAVVYNFIILFVIIIFFLLLIQKIIYCFTWMTPPPELSFFNLKKSSGNPIIFPNQFITIVSSSVQAGDDA